MVSFNLVAAGSYMPEIGGSNTPEGDTVQLALWFESRWGLSALHEHAFNEAQHARAWVASLERECERLRQVIQALEEAQAQPAANGPVFRSI
ncbi:MAG: hypothetical protein JSS56_07715 [Proteobacteria bacterium]|nr:hypothetical protein [Pseudomonadota bacterium]